MKTQSKTKTIRITKPHLFHFTYTKYIMVIHPFNLLNPLESKNPITKRGFTRSVNESSTKFQANKTMGERHYARCVHKTKGISEPNCE